MANAGKTRPKKRPGKESSPPKRSKRPMSREAGKATQSQRFKTERADRESEMAAGGKVKTYAKGGKCRGMGAAKRGGRYGKSG